MASTCIYATDTVTVTGDESVTNESQLGGGENEEAEEPKGPAEFITDLTFDKSEVIIDENEEEKVKLDFSWEINELEEGLEGIEVKLYKDMVETPENLVDEKELALEKEVSFDGLAKGTPYFIVVIPYAVDGSEKVYGKAVKGVGIYLDKPVISQLNVNGTIVDITFDPVAGAAEYVISYKTGDVENQQRVNSNTFNVYGLEENSNYDFKVMAVFETHDTVEDAVYTVESDWSEVSSITTGKTALGGLTLKLAAYNKGAILTWNKCHEATGYEIWRYYKNKWSLIKVVDANTLTYKNTGLTVNKKYYYKVRAIRTTSNGTIYGEYSPHIAITAKSYLTSTNIRGGYTGGVLKKRAKIYKEGSAYTVASKSKLKKGTKFTILEKRKIGKKTMAHIQLSNGKKYWIRTGTIRYTAPYTKLDYTTEVKENFVNKMGYSSSTNYMLFISNYTQKVYLFTGSKGNWDLKATYKCCTGKATTRTPRGVFKLYKKGMRTALGSKYVSYFKSKNALHARPAGSKTMGKPVSNGCVRLYQKYAIYIYKNIPKGTTVVSY